MGLYINGIGSISPQTSTLQKISSSDLSIRAIEPDYTKWIEPIKLRRMSRIVCMGVTSALTALKDAEIEKPDAIITGTGFGCLEDTGTFLTKMVDTNETGVTPTPFIQSTHNTVGSQIALLLSCHGYNQTYTHQSFSLESALLDAQMLLQEKVDMNVLVGVADEFTPLSHDLMQEFNLFNDNILHGEGAAYFLVSSQCDEKTYAHLIDHKTFSNPNADQLENIIKDFIKTNGKEPEDIDFLLYGGTGEENDVQVNAFTHQIISNDNVIWYKQYCGEYATSIGFALWLAAMLLRAEILVETLLKGSANLKSPKNILIYNPYLGGHHSLILLESCQDIR